MVGRLIFPHQLFTDHLQADANTIMVVIEDDLFFKQFKFHKQKLILHRASMKSFADSLADKGYTVAYIETSSKKSMDTVTSAIKKHRITQLTCYDVVDDWLQKAIDSLMQKTDVKAEKLVSPAFLTTNGEIEDYFDNNPNRMQYFYEWQRKRLDILVKNGKPVGGKWSFDEANRKKLPKDITLPQAITFSKNKYVADAQTWVDKNFPNNPGNSESFQHAVTHEQAQKQLKDFLNQRLNLFGPYEDAVAQSESQLFHSLLSSPLNCGLLTPRQVVDETLAFTKNHNVPIESLEGFMRQIIGWREYMRATYVRYGSDMRTKNYLTFSNTLHKSWWDATVGIEPIDTTIEKVLSTGYAHHIERLMILGNSMVLLRIDPDEVYEWFMSLFIDAYDWVMVPNVYAMSQFAAGEMITTKPYISGSNYIIKMSDYKKGEWSEVWDALYWQFVADHTDMIEKNYRMNMMSKLYNKFDDEKKCNISCVAKKWIH